MHEVPYLVHGMGSDLEAPRWPAISDAEAATVLALFPQAGRFDRLDWHSPRPFSSAALARTESGDIFVKRHQSRLRTPTNLAAEHRFIRHLAARGQPVAEILQTDSGETAIGIGDWTWEVHRKAEGLDLYRDRQSWTPFLTAGHAEAAGASLARLHDAAEGFDQPARPVQPLVTSLTILPARDPLAAAESYVEARPALSAYLAGKPWRHALSRLFAAHDAGPVGAALVAQRALWTHNDWHPSNLLWSAGGTVARILDFGLADRTCAFADLATALERTAIRWLDLDAGGGVDIAEPDLARSLLQGYADVRPLDPASRAILIGLLPLVHIEFALSEIDYFYGVQAREADADLAWYGYLLGHAEWFRTAPGRALLAGLESAVAA
ncbi:phosphotransferase enzyme family protein [Sphingomonas abietis]|uniref:Phosphotransferase n=1 Tax=Sphingomonas abietis TaxID=3012344 RepID=A0ABY7NJY4_9SPHN|nr:phosphotransferase [Sphingomonas abietis]WBO21557.1 phosphotransferase [Sphingomonas abietis]